MNEPDDQNLRRSFVVEAPDGTAYRVLASKRGLPFDGWNGGGSGVVETILGMVTGAVLEARAENRERWKVGFRRVRQPWRIRGRENLPDHVAPDTRMAELADDIRHGRVT